MPRADDDSDDDWQDDDDSDDGYVPCPYCGETMLEDAEYCPACDRWMTNEELPARRHPWWIIIVALVLIGLIVVSVLP